MSEKDITFPVYRKYSGINVWFKILDDRNFIEIKQLGSKFLSHQVEAVQYPEMVLIMDMINCHENRWEEMDGKDFEGILNKIE